MKLVCKGIIRLCAPVNGGASSCGLRIHFAHLLEQRIGLRVAIRAVQFVVAEIKVVDISAA